MDMPVNRPIDLSIVICTRNRAKTLPDTLRSLSSLRSRYEYEIIVADNASTDETADVIRRAGDHEGRLRYIFVGTGGLGAAREAGWRAARGRIIAFTDDDCYPEASYADAVVDAFEHRPEAGCIGGRILLHDPADLKVTIDEREAPVRMEPRRFVAAGSLHGANLSFRQSALEATGGFDRDIGVGTAFPFEDIDAVAAVLWSGRPAWFDPAPVVRHHHRRRGEAAHHRLFLGYDWGRGAYYAKYILRPDSRSAYLRAWWSITRRYADTPSLIRFGRELMSFFAYLHHRKAYGFSAAAAPVAALSYTATAAMVAVRMLKKRWHL